MTAGWWIPGEMKNNYVSWKTAKVPRKRNHVCFRWRDFGVAI